MKEISFKEYLVEFGKTACFIPPTLAAISSLSGLFILDSSSYEAYIFPPVGSARPLAGGMCFMSIFIAMLIGYTLIKSKHTKALARLFALSSFIGIMLYFYTWQKIVVTVEIPSEGTTRSIAVGSVRSPLAISKYSALNDHDLVHKEGAYDARVHLYWTEESIVRMRCVLAGLYLLLIVLITLCMGAIVAGKVSQESEARKMLTTHRSPFR